MSNRDVSATWQYHNATKHSLQSLRASAHVLDWANQPLPYKIYPSLAPIPLPGDFPPSAVPALDAIAAPRQAHDESEARHNARRDPPPRLPSVLSVNSVVHPFQV